MGGATLGALVDPIPHWLHANLNQVVNIDLDRGKVSVVGKFQSPQECVDDLRLQQVDSVSAIVPRIAAYVRERVRRF